MACCNCGVIVSCWPIFNCRFCLIESLRQGGTSVAVSVALPLTTSNRWLRAIAKNMPEFECVVNRGQCFHGLKGEVVAEVDFANQGVGEHFAGRAFCNHSALANNIGGFANIEGFA